MASSPKWLQESFTSSVSGCNSAVEPDLVSPSGVSWGYNVINRGGRPKSRPYLRFRTNLPRGLVQGASYFSIQNGMGIIMVDGRLYRIRIGEIESITDSYEECELGLVNFPNAPRVWMCQTIESLVIQNFVDDAIIYDGSVARRSVPSNDEVPRGKQMAYGNGRLWVAVDDKTLAAGDIRTNVPGSELKFTETNYLSGGGTFTFQNGITGLGFIPTTGTSDYGALMVFGRDSTDSVRADVTYRDQWSSIPSFITSVLRNSGCAGQASLCQVNQDLYWRDSDGGIRSVRSGLSDESGVGNSPISQEVSRLTDYDSRNLLQDCPSMVYNNRLIMGSSPFINYYGATSWKSLIVLDFAPVSTISGKASPEYDGEWSGLTFTHMFNGKINGSNRAFIIACSETGVNSLWEVMPDNSSLISDMVLMCDTNGLGDNSVTSYIETRRVDFGNINHKKRLERIDVYLAEILGTVDFSVYWRTDNNQKWRLANSQQFCANTTDPEVPGETSHIFKNILSQHRTQQKSFTLPVSTDIISKYALHIGFQFQFKIVWTGNCKIQRIVAHASALDETAFAMQIHDDSCITNDVT